MKPTSESPEMPAGEPLDSREQERIQAALESALSGRDLPAGCCDPQARELLSFVQTVRALDRGVRSRGARGDLVAFRYRLRRELYRREVWRERRGWSSLRRGVALALEYGRLRLMESRALRVAAILLFLHLLAVPVMAAIAHYRQQHAQRSHGEYILRHLPGDLATQMMAPAPEIEEEGVREEPPEDEVVEPPAFGSGS